MHHMDKIAIALDLLRLRHRQQLINEMLKKKAFGGLPIHVAMGHEAVAVAVKHVMHRGDRLLATHRNMHYNLALGDSFEDIVKEYACRGDGIASGSLGSMNLCQPGSGIPYASSILGNNMPVACGFALADLAQKNDAVVFVATGDGAMEEGSFYESLTFAKSHGLRIVFLIENNDMSMSSTIAQRRCPIDIGLFSEAFSIGYQRLDSNHIFEYVQALTDVRSLAVKKSEPICVEIITKSYNQHAGPTPGWPTDPKVVNLAEGSILESSSSDAIHVLKESITAEEYDQLLAKVVLEKEPEL